MEMTLETNPWHSHQMIRELVRPIIYNPQSHKWSLQGFGMLRLHLSDEVRLNVWLAKYWVPGVSMMHTHPWHFKSLIVVGELCNIRFTPSDDGVSYQRATIKPGPGGGLLEPLVPPVKLIASTPEYLTAGEVYNQAADEIHISQPYDGTVTLNIRERVGEDVAKVYWPLGSTWVSAEPRQPAPHEVTDFMLAARNLLGEGA